MPDNTVPDKFCDIYILCLMFQLSHSEVSISFHYYIVLFLKLNLLLRMEHVVACYGLLKSTTFSYF